MQPKKSLGQNFFCNKHLAQKIVNTALEPNPDFIIEIGPGTGSFSQLFQEKIAPSKIVAIEKDDKIAKSWDKYYPDIKLVHGDVLKTDLVDLIKQYSPSKTKTVTIFGSLPFNISKRIIKNSLIAFSMNPDLSFQTNLYYIIQKEVAQKYRKWHNNVNSLALLTKAIADFKSYFYINPECFRPKPKVESAYVRFSPNSIFSQHFSDLDHENLIKKYEKFSSFIHHCFANPRKTLFNNLKIKVKNEVLIRSLSTSLLSKRPHELSLDNYLDIFKRVYE